MTLLTQRIVRNSQHLTDREFRLLVVMADHARNNPPEFQDGRDVLAAGLGLRVGTESTHEIIRRVIASLIKKGAITRVQRGGLWSYACYQINDLSLM